MQQRTPEWFAARRSKITCSEMGRVIAMSKAYADQIRREIAGDVDDRSFSNAATEWGVKHEPAALAAYELRTGHDVESAGFIVHPEHGHIGGSPDGLVGSDGLVEAKCPYNHGIHKATRLAGIPKRHAAQIQGLLWVTGRRWCDFVSFDPRERAPLDLVIWRMHRDDIFILKLERACAKFWDMVTSDSPGEEIPTIF